ncbi:hypothetical protein PHMEG_0004798 [Phytophthora megakarya]|uniref:Eukaryotic/viral aspartic protease n=1 Tax=Phytophthora megakarya TaxID=4795 RepID=A0A225WSX2_9STRA|nr:hypothetical protein PHMEG_0004798 [Phytophthora megakarya]
MDQEQATQIRKAPGSAPAAPARAMVRAIQAQDPCSESEGVSGSDGSDSEANFEGSSWIPGDPERKRLREAGSPIVAVRETEITKIETAVLMETHGSGLLETSDM